MKETIKFGKWEATTLLVNALTVKIFLGLPQLMSASSGSALWLSALVSAVIMSLFVLLILKIYQRFPGMDIFAICQMVGGKPLKFCVSIILLLTLLVKSPLVLRLTIEGLTISTPYAIPILLATLLIAGVMVIAAYKGIEGIARMHAIFVPVIIAALVFIGIFTAHSYDATNLFPFWGLGAGNTLLQGASHVTIYSDLIYLFLLYPYINDRKQFSHSMHWGVNIAGIIFVLTNLAFILSLQYPDNTDFVMPVYQLSRIIAFGSYAQNLEAIFLPVWIISSLLYLCLNLYFIVHILREGFDVKHYKFGVIPAIIIIFIANFIPNNMMAAISFAHTSDTITFVSGVLLPFLLLLAALPAAKRRERRAL